MSRPLVSRGFALSGYHCTKARWHRLEQLAALFWRRCLPPDLPEHAVKICACFGGQLSHAGQHFAKLVLHRGNVRRVRGPFYMQPVSAHVRIRQSTCASKEAGHSVLQELLCRIGRVVGRPIVLIPPLNPAHQGVQPWDNRLEQLLISRLVQLACSQPYMNKRSKHATDQ